jgi:hypothetical protein
MLGIDLFVHMRPAPHPPWRAGGFLTVCMLIAACTIPAEERVATRGPAETDPALMEPATATPPATRQGRISIGVPSTV